MQNSKRCLNTLLESSIEATAIAVAFFVIDISLSSNVYIRLKINYKLEFSPSELDALGIKLKTVSVTFKSGENGKLTYMGSVSFFGAVTFGVSGEFDLRTLVEKCNWDLCKYRFDPGKIDDALAKAGVL
ncbi:hypothetical protein [Vibrio vulnificus]|uniref:hypothetical protein n=1 Tax=Vibrio vulnificus TaxID=672 RepID=UPI0032425750